MISQLTENLFLDDCLIIVVSSKCEHLLPFCVFYNLMLNIFGFRACDGHFLPFFWHIRRRINESSLFIEKSDICWWEYEIFCVVSIVFWFLVILCVGVRGLLLTWLLSTCVSYYPVSCMLCCCPWICTVYISSVQGFWVILHTKSFECQTALQA